MYDKAGSSNAIETTPTKSSSFKPVDTTSVSAVAGPAPASAPNNPPSSESNSSSQKANLTIDTSPPPPSDNTTSEGGRPTSLWNNELIKLMAITKIQRSAKRNAALRAARAETQWKLFAELDTRDEAEMLSLAVFMQTLMDTIAKETPDHQMLSSRNESIRELTRSTDDMDGSLLSPKSMLSREISQDNRVSMTTPAGDEVIELVTPPPPPPSVDAREFEDDFRGDRDSLSGPKGLVQVNFKRLSSAQKTFIPILNHQTGEYDFTHVKVITPLLIEEIIRIFREGKHPLSKNSVIKVLRIIYKSMKTMPNTTELTIDSTTKLTVVGDTHGQLADLLHILDECGLPNENNKFIFNGDFVDRGVHGFEVVFLIFLLHVIYGGNIVALNRGNHEEAAICRVYGFEKECTVKYDRQIFEMFMEVFRHLPLFTTVNQRLFVVHGGLFHTSNVSLEDLSKIPRTNYVQKPTVPFPQNCEGKSDDEVYDEFLKQLQREALWSDPTPNDGLFQSHRGAGVFFGPNITKEFMARNGFDMVIRSHECVYRGIDFPYGDVNLNTDKADGEEVPPFLCTLFSASNYQNGANYGAILQFATHPFGEQSVPVNSRYSATPDLYYSIKRYRTTLSRLKLLTDSNKTSLRELILKKKSALVSAFEAVDTTNCGTVTRLEWAEVMQRVTMIKILWLSIISILVPPESLTPSSVKYRDFIHAYTMDLTKLQRSDSSNSVDDGSGRESGRGLVPGESVTLDDIYGQRKKLEQIFYFFDLNGDGVISSEEFKKGTEVVNSALPPDCQLKNIDRMLQLMDFDGSGTIDINEFFETFRILDAKDGQVDGVLSLAQK